MVGVFDCALVTVTLTLINLLFIFNNLATPNYDI